jgi:hypothetical protein
MMIDLVTNCGAGMSCVIVAQNVVPGFDQLGPCCWVTICLNQLRHSLMKN